MRIKFFTCLLLSLASTLAFAAKPVIAPIKHLSHERNQISVIKVKQVLSDRNFVFEKVTDLWGKGPETFKVRLEREPVNEIKVGQQLIAAYSDKIRKPIVRDIRETDPRGYRILHISVADYALFTDNENLRRLIKIKTPTTDNEKQQFIRGLLSEIQNRDYQNSALAMFEFSMHRELYPLLNANELKQIESIVKSKKLSDELQELLLSSTMEFPKSFSGQWVAESCRDIFKESNPQFDLTSFRPLLAKTCARLLSRFGSAKDIEALSQFIFSNNPGVAKSAINTINKLSAESMVEIAKRTYKSNDVHVETRRVLEQLVKR